MAITIRNWKVAAPLKAVHNDWASGLLSGNPQLKSCGSIEGRVIYLLVSLLYSAIRNWKVAAPLKDTQLLRGCNRHSAIRNWKVAAPLKGLKGF